MPGPHDGRRRRLPFAAAAAALVASLAAYGSLCPAGAWSEGAHGSGTANARLAPVPAAPIAVLDSGAVVVDWSPPADRFGPGPVAYEVRRYDPEGRLATPGPGCDQPFAGTTCTEDAVPAGTWIYAVVARQGPWTTQESAPSEPVLITP